jgi:heme A synthase
MRSERGRRKLRIWTIVIIGLLAVQGFTGDTVNLFSAFPNGIVSNSLDGLVRAIAGAGGLEVYHAVEGAAIFVLSILVLVLAWRAGVTQKARLMAILGLAATTSAVVGGTLFVLSGFKNDGNSAQMGGSFISAYAFYFLTLYFTKPPEKNTSR